MADISEALLRGGADAEVVEIGRIDALVFEQSANNLGMSAIDRTLTRQDQFLMDDS